MNDKMNSPMMLRVHKRREVRPLPPITTEIGPRAITLSTKCDQCGWEYRVSVPQHNGEPTTPGGVQVIRYDIQDHQLTHRAYSGH